MDTFKRFKDALKNSVANLKKSGKAPEDILRAIDVAKDWESLEHRLIELRTINRKRQQEILDRLEPLAQRVEDLLAQAKDAKFKVKRQNLLRQADDLMRELEAEDQPAMLYSVNGQTLTGIITQVRKARAMEERGIDADAIDMVASNLELVTVDYESAFEAAKELEEIGNVTVADDAEAGDVEARLAKVYADDSGGGTPVHSDNSGATETEALKQRLYEDALEA